MVYAYDNQQGGYENKKLNFQILYPYNLVVLKKKAIPSKQIG